MKRAGKRRVQSLAMLPSPGSVATSPPRFCAFQPLFPCSITAGIQPHEHLRFPCGNSSSILVSNLVFLLYLKMIPQSRREVLNPHFLSCKLTPRRGVILGWYLERGISDGFGPQVFFHPTQHQQKANICRMPFFGSLKYPLLIFFD